MEVLDHAGAWWLLAAVLLAGTELLLPGIFLVFLALAAAVTGILTLLFSELGLAGQMVSFAAWSVASVLIGRRWYHEHPIASADPLLNDRVARLVGELAVVTQPIEGGRGRVRIGDGEWPAAGPDLLAGSHVRITRIEGGVVIVEALPASSG
jgi:inner membrane protein